MQKHEVEENRVLVTMSGQQCPTPITVALKLRDEAKCISEGDMIWFDDRKVYWTPKNQKTLIDHPIDRVAGGSSRKDIRTATYYEYKPTHGGYGGF